MSGDGPITVIVVSYNSAAVLGRCLDALRDAAPRRGVRVRVADNASLDDSAGIARARIGADAVTVLPQNRGFAAGVNVALRDFDGPWLALVNPDAVVPAGALDALADRLAADATAGIIAPRVRTSDGGVERSTGYFPTLAREWRQALGLTALSPRAGRMAPFPAHTARVDWVSGCAWLLRGEAARAAGAMDEGYFMYWEDVDYCRLVHDAGWSILATPEVEILHDAGTGSSSAAPVAIDGELGLLRYFARHLPTVPTGFVAGMLAFSYSVRWVAHTLRALSGHARSRRLAQRYARALALLRSPQARARACSGTGAA